MPAVRARPLEAPSCALVHTPLAFPATLIGPELSHHGWVHTWSLLTTALWLVVWTKWSNLKDVTDSLELLKRTEQPNGQMNRARAKGCELRAARGATKKRRRANGSDGRQRWWVEDSRTSGRGKWAECSGRWAACRTTAARINIPSYVALSLPLLYDDDTYQVALKWRALLYQVSGIG